MLLHIKISRGSEDAQRLECDVGEELFVIADDFDGRAGHRFSNRASDWPNRSTRISETILGTRPSRNHQRPRGETEIRLNNERAR